MRREKEKGEIHYAEGGGARGGKCCEDETRRATTDDVPAEHLATMKAFLAEFSGICNFNYKLRPEGGMCIFEVNARIGADLACDATRSRAAQVRA